MAVADGVNVAGEIYNIETEVSKNGGTVCKGQIEKREKLTRRKRWEQQDTDETYSAKKLDKDIVNPSQIRTVIKTFRDHLPQIFPDRIDSDGNHEIPKTLIFAKTDSHADDIINIVREEFGEGNRFCKKVTFGTSKGVKKITFDEKDDTPAGRTEDDEFIQDAGKAKDVLSEFRNEYYPRIAVTVDMIATGTDVKPLECLLFMRDVKSKGYFEQMKGRGTRTLDHDGLKKVTTTAKTAKLRYVIVDAIGATKSLKTSSRPPISKPSVTLKNLAMPLIMGQGLNDTDAIASLAGRLARIDRHLSPEQQAELEKKTGGVPLSTITKSLFNSIDGDAIETKALDIANQPAGTNPGDTARDQAQAELVKAAIKPLTGAAVTHIVDSCKANLQTVDHSTIDVLLGAGWDNTEAATKAPQDFETFLQENKDELTALTIFFDQPYRLREITYEMINEVMKKLQATAPTLAPLDVWQAYAKLDEVDPKKCPLNKLNALVSLIRRVCGLDEKLTPFNDTVRRNFQQWILKQNAGSHNTFTEDQHAWLKLIRDHISTSFHLEIDDLDYAPFDSLGGIGKMYQLFGDQMNDIIEELNGELVA